MSSVHHQARQCVRIILTVVSPLYAFKHFAEILPEASDNTDAS